MGGQTIQSHVKFLPEKNAYECYISCVETGESVTTVYPVLQNATYTDVFFVLEHQPDLCAAYPSDDSVVFRNIHIERENKLVHEPKWTKHLKRPACESQAHILSKTSVSFSWKS